MANEFEMNGVPMVIMTRVEYESLVEDMNFLVCLQAAGVDNWEGYSVARQMYRGELDEEEY